MPSKLCDDGRRRALGAALLAVVLLLPALAFAQSRRRPLPASDILLRLPRDLSPWGMFMAADIVVKAVMIGLAFASVLTWTIWFAKAIELMTRAPAPARGDQCARGAAVVERRRTPRAGAAAPRR